MPVGFELVEDAQANDRGELDQQLMDRWGTSLVQVLGVAARLNGDFGPTGDALAPRRMHATCINGLAAGCLG